MADHPCGSSDALDSEPIECSADTGLKSARVLATRRQRWFPYRERPVAETANKVVGQHSFDFTRDPFDQLAALFSLQTSGFDHDCCGFDSATHCADNDSVWRKLGQLH